MDIPDSTPLEIQSAQEPAQSESSCRDDGFHVHRDERARAKSTSRNAPFEASLGRSPQAMGSANRASDRSTRRSPIAIREHRCQAVALALGKTTDWSWPAPWGRPLHRRTEDSSGRTKCRYPDVPETSLPGAGSLHNRPCRSGNAPTPPSKASPVINLGELSQNLGLRPQDCCCRRTRHGSLGVDREARWPSSSC